MTGYSDTALIKKLGITPGSKILFINEPASIYDELGELPDVGKISKKEKFDYIHFFTREKSDLEKFFKEVKKFLDKNGMLWISWPKKTSKVATDLDENIIRKVGLSNGLVDVKVAAIDHVWSGLKFVYRLTDRKLKRQ